MESYWLTQERAQIISVNTSNAYASPAELIPPRVGGLCYQRRVSQAEISNCIPQNAVGYNYLSLPEMPLIRIYIFWHNTINGHVNIMILHWPLIFGRTCKNTSSQWTQKLWVSCFRLTRSELCVIKWTMPVQILNPRCQRTQGQPVWNPKIILVVCNKWDALYKVHSIFRN